MKNMPEDLGLVQITRELYAVLKDSSPLATYGISNDGCRYEVVRVEDYHVLGIVHNTLAMRVKISN
jgi:hypothetical protein